MAGKLKYISSTFDVDLTDYRTLSSSNEMEEAFPLIKSALEKNPPVKTTWFIRIDEQIKSLFGNPLYIFKQFQKEIDWLLKNGHELGWHHHAYAFQNNRWVAEKSEEKVIRQLKKYAQVARAEGLKISRMGWGYQTNAIVDLLENAGFEADSSAIPRPMYQWDNGLKNWEGASQNPYYPSSGDYRKSGPKRRILQVPINTVGISLATDTQPGIMRYVNTGYKESFFRQAVSDFESESLVTITHPYELIPSKEENGILAFSEKSFNSNLQFLCAEETHKFLTITQLTELYR